MEVNFVLTPINYFFPCPFLDLKILGQLAELISGIDKEVLPTLKTSLEPILSTLLAQQNNNLDLGQVISYVTQTVQKSTFHVGISGHLGSYDFLEIGIIYFCSSSVYTMI